jgi:hypothetical protein
VSIKYEIIFQLRIPLLIILLLIWNYYSFKCYLWRYSLCSARFGNHNNRLQMKCIFLSSKFEKFNHQIKILQKLLYFSNLNLWRQNLTIESLRVWVIKVKIFFSFLKYTSKVERTHCMITFQLHAIIILVPIKRIVKSFQIWDIRLLNFSFWSINYSKLRRHKIIFDFTLVIIEYKKEIIQWVLSTNFKDRKIIKKECT